MVIMSVVNSGSHEFTASFLVQAYRNRFVLTSKKSLPECYVHTFLFHFCLLSSPPPSPFQPLCLWRLLIRPIPRILLPGEAPRDEIPHHGGRAGGLNFRASYQSIYRIDY